MLLLHASLKQGSIRMSSSLTTKAEDAFVTHGYTNWKDASGEKRGGFPTHERSQVCVSTLIIVEFIITLCYVYILDNFINVLWM